MYVLTTLSPQQLRLWMKWSSLPPCHHLLLHLLLHWTSTKTWEKDTLLPVHQTLEQSPPLPPGLQPINFFQLFFVCLKLYWKLLILLNKNRNTGCINRKCSNKIQVVSVCLFAHVSDFHIFFLTHFTDHSLDRSLMINRRKNSWNPERVSSVFTFVSGCVSACVHAGYRAHLLTYEPNFWVKWSLGHDEKTHFVCFSKFSFLLFLLAFFDFFLI